MPSYDLSPLFRTSVGFDRLNKILDAAQGVDSSTGYPPYNIEKREQDRYGITMAVAGFAESDLDVTVLSGEEEIPSTVEHTRPGTPSSLQLERVPARRQPALEEEDEEAAAASAATAAASSSPPASASPSTSALAAALTAATLTAAEELTEALSATANAETCATRWGNRRCRIVSNKSIWFWTGRLTNRPNQIPLG